MFAVHCAARRFNSFADEAMAADGLSFLEGLVLAAVLFEAPRQIKPSQLAETFRTTRANVSHTLSSLEAKGLLGRRIDPEDARGYLLTLKPAGKRCAMRVVRAHDRMQQAFEREVGRTPLAETLRVIRVLEELTQRGR
ncbi:MAG TPA: MarR family transcriptional regulator [Acidobacteriaceae bacterium]|nr:MarR family transcriptional regulator [Acidobacteriaceae bacterium]